jgi:phage terminase large subunit-like protein
MKKVSAQSCAAASLASLMQQQLEQLLSCFSASELRKLRSDWRFWGRPDQLPPGGDWRCWVFMGGRGAGKTRAGAEWVQHLARSKRAGRIALVGPTFHDVREVMIEGASGVRAVFEGRPRHEPSRRRLLWDNGALGYCFSAEDPESLRGPQFDAAWCDELCVWTYPNETLETLEHGMRLGDDPRMLVTTTPRPLAALRRMLAAPDTVLTRASTWDNEINLSARFIAALNERWAGTARHRQELLGELIEDAEGALWRRGELEALRLPPEEALDRIVVAVDPPASSGPDADACGIVAAGAKGWGAARRAWVLADASIQGAAPHVWAARAAATARAVGAHSIVAEANNGGEMVRAVLKAAAPDLPVRLVRASDGKRTRAEPIAALYAQGRVRHATAFAALEDEMCAFGAEASGNSPDRVDAVVWALSDLMLGAFPDPRMRIV